MIKNKQLAFVFPGQGSQKQGMFAELAESYSLVEETFAEASAVLGYDLWALSQSGSQEELNMTERTQPLLLTASVAIWRIWQAQGGSQPAFMAGHSLGEWSALVCSGVLAFSDAVKLVQLRGRYMQEAVPAGVGSMAAIIGLDDDIIVNACKDAEQGEVVSAVNFNSPGQVVIAGHKDAIARAGQLCKDKGAKGVIALAVSAPFHSALLKPAADCLAVEMEQMVFNAPTVPIVHNVTGKVESDAAIIKQLMIEQIYHPVLWVDCIKALGEFGVEQLVEMGPGKVLSGLTKRIDRSLRSFPVDSPERLLETLESVSVG